MKLANDALIAIIGVFQKGLVDGIDVSELLRSLDLVHDGNGKLRLNPNHDDIWTPRKFA